METIYDFTAKGNRGEDIDFARFKGKGLLIVNTASRCGLTHQYKGLEELHKKYKDLGLVVIGFPCNQFARQEPGTDEEIAAFCDLNFGVSFQMMKKINVNGKDAAPIFKYLREKTGGVFRNRVNWNFTKFLVSKDGEVIERFIPLRAPASLERSIIEVLNHQ